MTADILITAPISPWLQQGLDALPYHLHRLWEQPDITAFLTAEGAAMRAVITHGNRGLTSAEMALLPNLGLIAVHGVGTDAIDLAQAKARGIPVTITGDVLTDAVADQAVGLLYAARRQVAHGDRFVRRGDWAAGKPIPLARNVAGSRIGILGLGAIGRAIALRLEPIAASIAYCNRRPAADAPYPYLPTVLELAQQVDVLFAILPGGAESDGIIDAAVMEALGPDGTLINVGRGNAVDEAALIAALQDKRLGSAGLDVFQDEPHVPAALLALENVALAPHQGSATVDARIPMAQSVLDNIAAFLDGRPLHWTLD